MSLQIHNSVFLHIRVSTHRYCKKMYVHIFVVPRSVEDVRENREAGPEADLGRQSRWEATKKSDVWCLEAGLVEDDEAVL